MGYSKLIYKRASAELSRRKTQARELYESRQAEIAKKIPEILQIQREMAETAVSVTRTVMVSHSDMTSKLQELRTRNLDLQHRREELLVAAGYPANYLAEQKACDKCAGSGYIGAEMCDCLHELLKKEAYVELNAVSQVKASSFADFQLELYPVEAKTAGEAPPRAHMAKVFSFCKQYAEGFSLTSDSILMLGHTGLGKTHLSLAIASKVTELGFGVVYISVQKLMDKLEASKFSYESEAKEQYARDLDNVLTCDLLVLDDLGAEFITQFSSSTLYNIVNSRMVESKPTIISTNFEFSEIESKYSPRMVSRLTGSYTVLKFLGADIRYIKKMRQ